VRRIAALGVRLALLLPCVPATVLAATFEEFLAGVRAEAAADGVRAATLDRAFAGVAPIARVIELDRYQPERTMTFEEYMAKRVSESLVADARLRHAENLAVLDAVEARYGVPSEVIVALWGLESRFGEHMGNYSVIGSLATLAYDARRPDFFRKELIAALHILDQGHVRPEDMMGSWAGAMGQSQFMPSSFLSYAVDYDADGRRDIWATRADVFASAANYLARAGWRPGEPWGLPVVLPAGFDTSAIGNRDRRPVAEWKARGVRAAPGHALPADAVKAALVRPAGDRGPVYMVLDNYQAILRWNRSDYFAMSVVTLADRIAR
jgi:membrane-bound lytic murein transglycosylase B